MENNKYKYLLKNIGILTLGNFGSKILSFLLIPLYTSILSTEEYGIYDLYSTTISLLTPILTICITSAIMRFLLDKKNCAEIVKIGLKTIAKSIIIFLILIIINYKFNIIEVLNRYILYFFLMFVSNLLYDFLSQFSRGIEKVKNIAIAGVINSVILLTLNIVFLIWLKLGLQGYFLANIISLIIPSIYLIFSTQILKYLNLHKIDKELSKEMKKYSKPMVVNTLGWWITNISDRYIVTYICGLSANGVYSISYKLPSIMNIIQDIFNKVWSLSAVKEFNKEDKDGFFKNIYNLYNFGMTLVCSILIIFSKLIARILFSNEFFEAWKYSNFLMISVVFGALIGILDGVFIANKKSNIIGITTTIGSIINIVFNILLINAIGVIGAAISTMISYIFVWGVKLKKIKEILNLKINLIRDLFSYISLILQASILLSNINEILKYIIDICLVIIILLLYKDLIREGYNFLKVKFNSLKQKI